MASDYLLLKAELGVFRALLFFEGFACMQEYPHLVARYNIASEIV
jgi:hypothetical protein